MKALLKAVLSAAAFGVVVAGAVILYMEHKIDQATEAAVAPVVEAQERVDEAIGEVAGTVEVFATSFDSTVDEVTNRMQGLGEDAAAFVESSADRTGESIGQGAVAVKELWHSAKSEIFENWGG